MTKKDLLDLSKMTTEDYDWVVKSVKREKGKRAYKLPGSKFDIYIKPDYDDHFEDCIAFAYQKHWIKAESKYAFGSWATEIVIKSILGEIRRSKQNSDLKNSQT